MLPKYSHKPLFYRKKLRGNTNETGGAVWKPLGGSGQIMQIMQTMASNINKSEK